MNLVLSVLLNGIMHPDDSYDIINYILVLLIFQVSQCYFSTDESMTTAEEWFNDASDQNWLCYFFVASKAYFIVMCILYLTNKRKPTKRVPRQWHCLWANCKW